MSLDSLRSDVFRALTGRDALPDVLRGIESARTAGFDGLKIDTVVLRGTNDDELVELLRFGREHDAEVRFIEYMDVGGATHWSPDKVLPADAIRSAIAEALGPVTAIPGRGSAPAQRYALEDGSTFGIIASVSEPFCRDCDRSRLTADGMWLFCLYAETGIDMKRYLRGSASREAASDEALRAHIQQRWATRSDRGAEKRAASPSRGAFVSVDALRRDPHLEMHKRGG